MMQTSILLSPAEAATIESELNRALVETKCKGFISITFRDDGEIHIQPMEMGDV